MRGPDERMGAKLIAVIPEKFDPLDHPLRPIRDMVDRALLELSPDFSKMYFHTERPSVPPEKLLKALVLQIFYSVRSVRRLMEEVNYSILFRWFLDMAVDDPVWDHSTFSQNQERLLRFEIAAKFLSRILDQAKEAGLLSDEHFTVDGTLVEAWASLKIFRPKDGPPPPPAKGRNDEVDYRGQKRKNDTRVSTTDPQAKLYRKGDVATKLSYSGSGSWRAATGSSWTRSFVLLPGPRSGMRRCPWWSGIRRPNKSAWGRTSVTTRDPSSQRSER